MFCQLLLPPARASQRLLRSGAQPCDLPQAAWWGVVERPLQCMSNYAERKKGAPSFTCHMGPSLCLDCSLKGVQFPPYFPRLLLSQRLCWVSSAVKGSCCGWSGLKGGGGGSRRWDPGAHGKCVPWRDHETFTRSFLLHQSSHPVALAFWFHSFNQQMYVGTVPECVTDPEQNRHQQQIPGPGSLPCECEEGL